MYVCCNVIGLTAVQDMGLIAFGKLESGRILKGMKAIVMPDRKVVVIESLTHQDKEVILTPVVVLVFLIYVQT